MGYVKREYGTVKWVDLIVGELGRESEKDRGKENR